jgi:hypothetical protein
MARRLWIWLFLGSVGCGETVHHRAEFDPPPGELDDDPPFGSGTRLRARIYDGGQGAEVFVEWQDTELDLPCSFRRARDGELRCLPHGGNPFEPVPLEGKYIDAACTEEIWQWFFGRPAVLPAFSTGVAMFEQPCGEPSYAVRKLGQRVPAGSPAFRRDPSTGACTAAVDGLVGDGYAFGDEVDPNLFVRGSREMLGPGRLRPLRIDADDGAFERIGVWDAELDTDCSELSSGVCTPTRWAWPSTLYLDGACTTTADMYDPSQQLSVIPDVCSAPQFVADPSSIDECGRRQPRHYELREQLPPGSTFTRDMSGECVPGQLSRGNSYARGPELPSGWLAPVTAGRVGTGRLRRTTYTTAEGTRLDSAKLPVFFDEATGSSCYRAKTCDGGYACNAEGNRIAYDDARCTHPLFIASGTADCALTATLAALEVAGKCWDGRLVEIGEPLERKTVWVRDFDGTCVESALEAHRSWVAHATSASPFSAAPLVERLE